MGKGGGGEQGEALWVPAGCCFSHQPHPPFLDESREAAHHISLPSLGLSVHLQGPLPAIHATPSPAVIFARHSWRSSAFVRKEILGEDTILLSSFSQAFSCPAPCPIRLETSSEVVSYGWIQVLLVHCWESRVVLTALGCTRLHPHWNLCKLCPSITHTICKAGKT